MEVIIDLDLIDDGEENPFEKIASYIEKASLVGKISDKEKNSLMTKTLSLERKLLDLSESEYKEANIILKEAYSIASVASKIAEVDANDVTTFALQQGMQCLNNVVKIVIGKKEDEIKSHFKTISPKAYLTSKKKLKVTRTELTQALTIASTRFGIFHSAKGISHKVLGDFQNSDYEDEWSIDLIFNTNKFENHVPLDFIYQFVEILNKIDGVKVIIEEIKIGSIKAKLKVLFEEASSKEEVKELLESSRKFAKAKLEKDYEEQEKIKAEKNKIDVEKEILREQLRQDTSIESDYRRALEIQSMEEDLQSKRLENISKRMQLLKESRDLYKELLADGYISQKDFEMLIKEISFMKINDGRLEIGESTDIIDNM